MCARINNTTRRLLGGYKEARSRVNEACHARRFRLNHENLYTTISDVHVFLEKIKLNRKSNINRY